MPVARRDRMVLLVDVLVALWVVAWIVVGLRIAAEADGLRDLGESVARTGAAIERTGAALGSLDLPFVGGEVDEVAAGVVETGRSTQRSAAQAQDSASNLSTLLGVAIALIPSTALLIPYVPLRVARVRERRALALLEQRYGDRPEFERLLADRAVQHLGYRRLLALDVHPWDAAADPDRAQQLADAERARLGLTRAAR